MGDDIDWLDLPGRWTYGVCGDGRIFFIKYGPARSPRGVGRGLGWGWGGVRCVAGGLRGVGGSVWGGNKGSLLLQVSRGTAASPFFLFLPSWGHRCPSSSLSLKSAPLAGEVPRGAKTLPQRWGGGS